MGQDATIGLRKCLFFKRGAELVVAVTKLIFSCRCLVKIAPTNIALGKDAFMQYGLLFHCIDKLPDGTIQYQKEGERS